MKFSSCCSERNIPPLLRGYIQGYLSRDKKRRRGIEKREKGRDRNTYKENGEKIQKRERQRETERIEYRIMLIGTVQ